MLKRTLLEYIHRKFGGPDPCMTGFVSPCNCRLHVDVCPCDVYVEAYREFKLTRPGCTSTTSNPYR